MDTMIIIVLLLLLVPGLVSVRIHWKKSDFFVSNYKFIICDYLIYTLVIIALVCAFIFITDKPRLGVSNVRFLMEPGTYTNSFVFKWSFIAFFLSVALPYIVKFYRYIRRPGSIGKDSEIIKALSSLFFDTGKEDEDTLL
jgi:hypothetical protein